MARAGLERLLEEQAELVGGRRLGLLAHPAAVDGRLTHAVDRLLEAGLDLRLLFGPEHGIRGAAPPETAVPDERDERSGLPAYSLHGARGAPTGEQLAEIDTLLIDLRDVGARFFTSSVTAIACLRACAAAGTAAIVLDRPNPLGGELLEGPLMADRLASPVGLPGLPIRHGLTLGELARLVVARERLDLDLTVVPADWRRHEYPPDRPWVPPSPNLPTPDAALVFPGTCLFEGTVASEGRGTAKPFEYVGAPGLSADRLARALADAMPGALARPVWFTPGWGRLAGRLCGGVQLHVVDRAAFHPVSAGLAVLAAMRRLDAAAWRPPEPDGVPWIDRLTGDEAVRQAVDMGTPVADLVASWEPSLKRFAEERRPYLLY